MNWNTIGAVGEIVGALVVVVSLVYLALQIRTQNTQSKLAPDHEISVGFRDATAKFANPDMSDILCEQIKISIRRRMLSQCAL